MSVGYKIMYAVGVTPWDEDEVDRELVDLVEGEHALQAGRALDLGCGTGADAVYLAQRGWHVAGVDIVPRALRSARQCAAAIGVDVTWVRGDVAALDTLDLPGPYDLVCDLGCFHGLSDADRVGYAEGVTRVSAPGANLLMFVFAPGRRGPAPRGIDRTELEARFGPHWQIVDAHQALDVTLPGPLRNADPHWYRLERR
ncbi:MAG: class I SAM-dependent methyltransferase [Actinobacteria bacterium]|nr:class I SAM-dependent methyltransferase [Actinomycetota bacterium]